MINYVLFFLGIMIVIISLIIFKKESFFSHITLSMDINEKRQREVLNNIEIAEKILEEFNEASEKIITDLDKKIAEAKQLVVSKIGENIKDQNVSTNVNSNPNPNHDTYDDVLLNDTKSLEYDDIREEHSNLLLNSNSTVEENSADEEIDQVKGIVRLFKDGYSEAEIAKKFNKGIGEIRLILNLKKE